MSENKVINAPKAIWLTYGNINGKITHDDLMRQGDVSWCYERVDVTDARYVRADIAHADNERLRKALEAYENPKNWTRSFDCDGKLINQHALYLPKIYAADKALKGE